MSISHFKRIPSQTPRELFLHIFRQFLGFSKWYHNSIITLYSGKMCIFPLQNDWQQKKEDKTRSKTTFPITHRTKRRTKNINKCPSLMEQNQNQTASHSDYYDWLPPHRLCNKRSGVYKKNLDKKKSVRKKKWHLKLKFKNNVWMTPLPPHAES